MRTARSLSHCTWFILAAAIGSLGCGGADGGAAKSSESLAAIAKPSGYTATRYPIVLAHGMSGFDKVAGVLEYWFEIPKNLRKDGARVYVTDVSAFESEDVRGEQLLAQVEQIVAITHCGKVNLVGHSQGGLDVRYVLAARPDLVASVTTIGSPHQGSPVADFIRANVTPSGWTETGLSVLGDAAGTLISLISGHDRPQDAIAGLDQLTSAGTAAYTLSHPLGMPANPCDEGAYSDDHGIQFFSWGGTSVLTNPLDIIDPALGIASLIFDGDNDGLVGRCSAHFGKVIRDNFAMNHLDEVNQVIGLVNVFETGPITVFRAHANRMKNAGI